MANLPADSDIGGTANTPSGAASASSSGKAGASDAVHPSREPDARTVSSHRLMPEETDTHLLAAHTPVHYIPPYPWYINFTMVRMKGDVVLTVRAPTDGDMRGFENRRMGETSSVRFTREMWREFVKQVAEANRVWEATDYLDSIV